MTRTTELYVSPHGVLRLRINGNPMHTAIIDADEARALYYELADWLVTWGIAEEARLSALQTRCRAIQQAAREEAEETARAIMAEGEAR